MSDKLKNYNKFDYIIILLITSLTFGGYGGAFRLCRVLAIAFSPLLFSRYSKCKDYASGIGNFFVCLFMYAFFSLLWTRDVANGCKELIYLLVHSVLFVELIVFARFAKKPLESFSMGWLIFLITCLPVSAWEIITDNHLPGVRESDAIINLSGYIYNRRYASHSFGDINGYNTILCFAVPWVYYRLMTYSKKMRDKLIGVAIIVFSFVICIYNGTRGGTIAMGIMLFFYIFRAVKSIKNVFFLIFVSSVVGWLVSYYGSDLFVVLGARADEDTRSEIWMTAWEAIKNDNFIGSGIGGNVASMTLVAKGSTAIPHNAVIELCLVYGVLFTITVLLYQFNLLKKTLRMSDMNMRYTLLMLFFSMPFTLLIDSAYLNAQGLYVFLATQFVFVFIDKIKGIYMIVEDD